jgi:hypothetical protein
MYASDVACEGYPTIRRSASSDPESEPLDRIMLRDTGKAHRDLSAERRHEALAYILAIIRRDPFVREAVAEEQQRVADGLWHRFRDVYDGLHHGEREDFARAMRAM